MKNYLSFVLSMVIFGSVGLFAKNIPLSANIIILARCLIGGFVLTILFYCKRKVLAKKELKENRKILIFSGIALGLNWLFFFETLHVTSVSIATILYYFSPIMIVFISLFFLNEKIELNKIVSIFASLLGLILIVGWQINTAVTITGLIFGLLAAFFYAILVLLNKQLKNLDSLTITIYQIWIAAIIMTIYVLIRHEPIIEKLTPTSVVCLLILGLVHTGFACYLYFSAIQKIPTQSIAILAYIDPLSALFFSALFLHERLSLLQWIGALLIIGSAVGIDTLKLKK